MAEIIATVGLQRIATVVLADINRIGVGTGTNTPASSDTQLQTETHRNTKGTNFTIGSKVQIRANFTNAELPSTMREVGWFMNGSDTANSGSLLSRALVTFVKGSNDLIVILEVELVEG
jgi:hypothetical protein